MDRTMDRVPNGHSTSNRYWFNVNTTSKRWKESINKFPRRFDELVQCNFDTWKFDVVSTYFVWCNFNGQKIDAIAMYVYRRNFDGWKFHVILLCFFNTIWCMENLHSLDVLLRDKICWLFWYLFLTNFWFIRNENGLEILHLFIFIKLQVALWIALKSWFLQDCSP